MSSDKQDTKAIVSDKQDAKAIVSDKQDAKAIVSDKQDAKDIVSDKQDAKAIVSDKQDAKDIVSDKQDAKAIVSGKQENSEPDPNLATAKEDPAAEPGSDALSTLRQAELQWAKATYEAAQSYWALVSSALATHQNALTEISRQAWDEEFAAFSDSIPSESPESPDEAATQAEEAVQKWRDRVESSRNQAYRSGSVVGRKLAEDWQRAWFDAMEKQNDANVEYRQAIGRAYGAGGPAPASSYSVIGDEGALPGMPMDWQSWRGMPWGY